MTRGIPTLPPGKKYRFFFDSFPARVEAKLPLIYEAHITYSASGRDQPFEEPYTLDLTFLLKTREARRLTMHDLATSTDEIVKTMKKWTKEGNGIRAYTVDSEVHDRELRIQLMLSGLRGRIDAGEVEDVAQAIKAGLVSINEEGEPPARWVKKLEAERTSDSRPTSWRVHKTSAATHTTQRSVHTCLGSGFGRRLRSLDTRRR